MVIDELLALCVNDTFSLGIITGAGGSHLSSRSEHVISWSTSPFLSLVYSHALYLVSVIGRGADLNKISLRNLSSRISYCNFCGRVTRSEGDNTSYAIVELKST